MKSVAARHPSQLLNKPATTRPNIPPRIFPLRYKLITKPSDSTDTSSDKYANATADRPVIVIPFKRLRLIRKKKLGEAADAIVNTNAPNILKDISFFLDHRSAQKASAKKPMAMPAVP